MTAAFDRIYELSFTTPEFITDIVGPPRYIPPTRDIESPLDKFKQKFGNAEVPKTVTEIVNLKQAVFENEQNKKFKDQCTIEQRDIRVTIRDLHIEAEVEYGAENKDNSNQNATLRIFNLSSNTLKFIKKGSSVVFKAGYKNPVVLRSRNVPLTPGEATLEEYSRLPIIFVGQVKAVYTERIRENVVTTVLCKDSSVTGYEYKISKTYPPNTTYRELILDLMNECTKSGIPYGVFVEDSTNNYTNETIGFTFIGDAATTPIPGQGVIPVPPRLIPTPDVFLKNGYVAEGPVLTVLQEVCNNIGYRAFVSLGKLYVEPKRYPNRGTLVVITPDSVKGNIEFESDGSGQTSLSDEGQDGIKAHLFLNGEISVDKKLRVKNHPEYNGDYNIISVKHRLSYEGNQWDTEVEAKEI